MSYASLDTQQMNVGAEVTQDYCYNQYLYREGGGVPLVLLGPTIAHGESNHSLG